MTSLLFACHLSCAQCQTLEALFIFCLVWSIGAGIVQSGVVRDRDRFEKFLKGCACIGTSSGDPVPPSQLPDAPLYEYCFHTQDLQWRSWKSMVPSYVVILKPVLSFLLVAPSKT